MVNYLSSGHTTPAQVSDIQTVRISAMMNPAFDTGYHHFTIHAAGYERSLTLRSDSSNAPPATIQFNLVSLGGFDPDLNDNGLPDIWESQYQLSLLAPGEDGPDDDPDHDGMKTRDEFRAGTHPLHADSVFKMRRMDLLPGSSLVQLIYKTQPGKLYVLQSTDNLKGTWRNLGPVFQATEFETVIETEVPPEGQVFFRLYCL